MASAGAKVFFCPRLAININLPIEKKNFRFLSVLHFEIRREGRLHFCTVAHEHRISASDVFDDGVMYYGSNCMKNRSYLVFTIKPDGYDYEVVEF